MLQLIFNSFQYHIIYTIYIRPEASWAVCVIIKSIPVFWLESIINMQRFPSVQLQLVLLGCVWGAIQCVCVCVCVCRRFPRSLPWSHSAICWSQSCRVVEVERTGCGQLEVDLKTSSSSQFRVCYESWCSWVVLTIRITIYKHFIFVTY